MIPLVAALVPKLAEEAAGAVSTVLRRFLPPEKMSEAERSVIDREIRNELLQRDFRSLDAAVQLAQQQTDVNKIEAASANLFVSGWRPFVGWVCGFGLAFQFIGASIFSLPTADVSQLTVLLAGMLGLGTLRTAEKIKGVS